MNGSRAAVLFAILATVAYADRGSFANSGGSTSATPSVTSNVSSPAGTLSLTCPGATPTTCSGGSFSFLSTDGSESITATFTSGSFVENCSGGGKGGHVTCSYSFSGYFSGTLTLNGVSEAINGVTYQGFGTGGAAAQGVTAYNSSYTPFYYSDSGGILRSDDYLGTNQIAYGTQGSGIGQFYGANGIALDAAGRIYVADTYNDRVVRIDDMTGKNWTTFGTGGAGQGQFSNPSAIAVDSFGRIYVLDAGNYRVVRIDDMNGTNWIAYGSAGSGVGQISQYLGSMALDSSGRIYIADTGNLRIVRFDDMFGANWTTLTQSQPINGATYSFSSPVAVALDSAGKIYIADNEYFAGALIRVDDMTGANWTGIYFGPQGTGGPGTIAVDAGGTVFAGGGIGGSVRFVVGMTGVLNGSQSLSPYGSYYVFGITPIPQPSPLPPALMPLPASLTFGKQNINTTSAAQAVNITNFGGSPLNLSIATSSGFTYSSTCPAGLIAGSTCTVSVSFAPTATGLASGTLTLTDNSGNLGSQQTVKLSGFATKPLAYVAPSALTFPAQLLNTASTAQTVVVLNVGNGPMQVSNVTASAPFSQSNNCAAPLTPGQGCSIQVSFTPSAIGPAGGSLTIVDDAGTQTVNLTGTGTTTAPVVTVTPASVLFPDQLVSTKSAKQVITITNTGTISVSGISTSVSGDFAKTTTCLASLGAGKHCTVSVTFTPTAVGPRTGALTINMSTGAQTVALTGTGTSAQTALPGVLSFAPSPVTFAGYTIGDNPSQVVKVTNTSGAAVGIQSVALKGGLYLHETNNCVGLLGPGASCSIVVKFVPLSYGTWNATITVAESSGDKDADSVTATSAPSS